MRVFTKSTAIVLTGMLVITAAIMLPQQPVFGEGGARRDVVRYAAMMDRLYLVEFEATQAGAPTNREQQIRQLEKLVIPTIENLGKDGRVRTGGLAAGSLSGTFVVVAKSEKEVDELVRALPAQDIMQWKVTELETFAQRAEIEKKVVQELKAQK